MKKLFLFLTLVTSSVLFSTGLLAHDLIAKDLVNLDCVESIDIRLGFEEGKKGKVRKVSENYLVQVVTSAKLFSNAIKNDVDNCASTIEEKFTNFEVSETGVDQSPYYSYLMLVEKNFPDTGNMVK